ncbi:MAG: DUF2220 domain-containing protein [Propionibacteriaceae bacterium]|nr:DUF2220 domain-containing protein [Propionibacteriaceae bacterium]
MFIGENLAPLRRLASLLAVVAIHVGGVDVVGLADVFWVAASPVWCWGDLDSHGLRILGSARKVLPQVQFLLMDLDTLCQFQRLAVPEPSPHPGEVGCLNAAESLVLDELRRTGLRLEQEHIDWGWAWERTAAVLGGG